MEHQHVHRRELILGGLAAGAVGLVTAGDLDYAGPERERIAAELDAIADGWEATAPYSSLQRLHRVGGTLGVLGASPGPGEWPELSARTLLMLAQGEADIGLHEEAADTARTAYSMALESGSDVLQGHAATIVAELYAAATPADRNPVRMLATARGRAGVTPVAVQAGALEAHTRAGQGEDAGVVRRILADAETVQGRLPAVAGWPRWTPAHLHAYGGLALVRTQAFGQASEWLAMAREESTGQPGIGAATRLYQAHGYAATDQWDGAHRYAADALSESRERGLIAAWLAGGLRDLSRQAAGRGGDWGPIDAATVEL